MGKNQTWCLADCVEKGNAEGWHLIDHVKFNSTGGTYNSLCGFAVSCTSSQSNDTLNGERLKGYCRASEQHRSCLQASSVDACQ